MRRSVLFFLVVTVLHIPSLCGKSIHLLILGDDKGIIKLSVENNIANIKESFSYLASAMNIPIRTKVLNADKNLLTRNHVINWINKERISSDDIVVLYYSGHGARTQDSPTIWPFGNFLYGEDVEFSSITDRLFAKRAALYIILLDCCNAFVPRTQIVAQAEKPESVNFRGLNKARIRSNCVNLFFKSKGLIIASSASPGELSFSQTCPGNLKKTGAYFTILFLNNLFEELQKDKSCWKDFLRKTREECTTLIRNIINDKELRDPDGNLPDPQDPEYRGKPQYRVFLRATKKSPTHLRKYLFERCKPNITQPQ